MRGFRHGDVARLSHRSGGGVALRIGDEIIRAPATVRAANADDAFLSPVWGLDARVIACSAEASFRVVSKRSAYGLDRALADRASGTGPTPGALTLKARCRNSMHIPPM